MQTAGFPQLIESLLTLVVLYYIVKFFARLFLPSIAKKVVEKATEQFKEQQKRQQTNSSKDVKNTNQAQKSNKIGEYVDFEEID